MDMSCQRALNRDALLFVLSCGGHGTRFAAGQQDVLHKALFPLGPDGRYTTLAYHLRMLPLGTWIGLAAGSYREQVEAHLKNHRYFGHAVEKIIWIPEHYQSALGGTQKAGIPRFPFGRGGMAAL